MDKQLVLILLGAYFIATGLLQIIKGSSYEKYAREQGVVDAHKSVRLSALILVAAGVGIMIPEATKIALYVLCAFLLASALSIHKFWDGLKSEDRVSEALHFGKNIGMIILLYALTLNME